VQAVDLLVGQHRQPHILAVEGQREGAAVPGHQIHAVHLAGDAGHEAGVLDEGHQHLVTVSRGEHFGDGEGVDVVHGLAIGRQARVHTIEPD